MEIREKEQFIEGDLISLRGNVYQLFKQRTRRCSMECGMYDNETRRCAGYCSRFDGDFLVFKFVGYETDFPKNTVAYTTPFASRYDKKLNSIRLQQKLKGTRYGKRLD